MSLLSELSGIIFPNYGKPYRIRNGANTPMLCATRRGCDGVRIMSRFPLLDEPTLQQRIKDYAMQCNTLNPVRTYLATAEEISVLFANVRPMPRKSTGYMWVGNK